MERGFELRPAACPNLEQVVLSSYLPVVKINRPLKKQQVLSSLACSGSGGHLEEKVKQKSLVAANPCTRHGV